MTAWGPYPGCTVVDVHDADSVRLTIPIRGSRKARDVGFETVLVGPATLTRAIRLYGCNAAELNTPAGVKARGFLLSVMPVGTVVTLLSEGYDKYGGRVDGSITLPDGRDLTAVMVTAGQAAPWNDGTGAGGGAASSTRACFQLSRSGSIRARTEATRSG